MVDLEVQISWQAHRLVKVEAQRSWRAQRFVGLRTLKYGFRGRRSALLTVDLDVLISWKVQQRFSLLCMCSHMRGLMCVCSYMSSHMCMLQTSCAPIL